MEALWLVAIWSGDLMQSIVTNVLIRDQSLDISEKCNQKNSDRLERAYKRK